MEKSIITIHDSYGNPIDTLVLDEPVRHIDGRVCIGTQSGVYYKGVGVPYRSHYITEPTSDYVIIEKRNNIYNSYNVIKKVYVGLEGIFQERYQSQFSDFIGSCGNKELSMIENEDFKLASTRLKKISCWDKTNNQYFMNLDYLCDRKKYDEYGNAIDLKNLLTYMIDNDWNFIWDKNSISDISYNGLVTDTADIFRSSELKSKIGTIYSVIYSLYHADYEKFQEFIDALGYEHLDASDFVYNTIRFLYDIGIDVSDFNDRGNRQDTYEYIVTNYLLTGKNCAECSFVGLGDKVKDDYMEKTKKLFEVKNGKKCS